MRPSLPVPILEPTEDVLRILEEYLEDLESGGKRRPDDLVAAHPELADSLRACLASLDLLHDAALSFRGARSETPRPSVTPLPITQRQLGDFRILREIGRGGMGVVYEAEQISLGRRVALKVLPSAAALDSKHLQRFRIEAQAAAHLRHPNIVSVHSVGCDEGVHYYAMDYIQGQSLADWILELRKIEGKDNVEFDLKQRTSRPDLTGLNWDQPANRDSWPASGSGVLAPFPGLSDPSLEAPRDTVIWRPDLTLPMPEFYRRAAALGAQAAAALEHAHVHGILHRDIKPANLLTDGNGNLWVTDFGLARFQDDVGLTMTGDLLGTIRYMSPEQALAKRGLVDHRADIYSLGVTLYELVTLEPAFRGRDRQELLRQIAFEDPVAPRRLNPHIPEDLQTILVKATAKSPEDRYDTAQALADDLRRFVEDRPILAKRPTIGQRLSRWRKRHRQLVAVGVGLVMLAALGSTLCAVLVWRAKEKTDVALLAEAQQRRRAEENLHLSLGTIDEMYLQVVEKHIEQNIWRDEDRRLLERAQHFYEEFATSNKLDPAARFQIAKANRHVGEIHARLGQHEEAIRAFYQAYTLIEMQCSERPYTFEERYELGLNCQLRATAFAAVGQNPLAMVELRMAAAEFDILATAHPGHFAYRAQPANCFNQMGHLHKEMGHLRDAERSVRQALDLDQKLVEDFPKVQDARFQLAQSHHNYAHLLRATGRATDAERHFRDSLRLLEGLVQVDDRAFKYRHRLATVRHNFALLLDQTGKPAEAEIAYKEALELQKELLVDRPQFFEGIRDLASSHQNLATLLLDMGRLAEAEGSFRESQKNLEQLVNDFPSVPAYKRELAISLSNLGNFLERSKRPVEAEEAYRKALGHLESLVETQRGPEYRQQLATCCNNLGLLFDKTYRSKEAEKVFREALTVYEQIGPELMTLPEYRSNVGATMSNLAKVLQEAGDLEQSRDLAVQAIGHQLAALRANPRNPIYGRHLRNHYSVLGDSLLRMKQHREAAKAAADWAGVAADSWEDCLQAADLLSRCVEQAESDPQLPRGERQPIVDGYVQHARELLRRSIERGKSNAVALNNIAWHLATCPDQRFRDASLAVELASHAVRKKPAEPSYWSTLSIAYSELGDGFAALHSGQKALELRGGQAEEVADCFVMAIAHWRAGDKTAAHRCYLRGTSGSRESKLSQAQLRRLQGDAAALLGWSTPSRTKKPDPFPID